MTDKKCEHDIGFTSWHKGNCLAGKTAFPRCPYCPKPKGDEMKSPSEIAKEIKEKFIASMTWSKLAGVYAQEDVKSIVMGNLNTITYRFAEAIESERKRAEGLQEVLAGMIESYSQLISLIFKTHISRHTSPCNPPKSCTICKDLDTAQINVETARKSLSSHEGREEGKEKL